MNELLAIAAITILAVISPGPDFAMVTRNSFAFGRKAGLLSALGIACGVQVHVFYTVFGIAVIIARTPMLFLAMKLVGSAYLIYVGFKSFTNKSKVITETKISGTLSIFGAFRTGFFTNVLNPKTMLFVISSYTQIVRADSSLAVNLSYGFFMSFAHWAWFSLVAIFFSSKMLSKALLDKQRVVDQFIGVALMALGASLILSGTSGT